MDTQSMVMTKSDNDVIEIDVLEVMTLLLHKLWLIILVAVITGGAAFGISKFVISPVYDSTTKIYILSKNDNSNLTYSDLQMGTQLTKDYAELIQSRTVIEQVIHNQNLKMDFDELSDNITVETPTDTRIVSITVRDTNQFRAQKIADEVRIVASEHITNVMDIQAVNVVENANYPDEKAGPSVLKWTVIGSVIGAFLVILIVLVVYMLDDSIKTSDDVEKYLGLSTLALIPYNEAEDVDKKAKGRKAKDVE